ncbi:hypothetical protein HY631_00520 [Candidatus Uhrbacteria bacterium]|nr:hypothetical protein [Candidatus Uhrbacteria bacterium]
MDPVVPALGLSEEFPPSSRTSSHLHSFPETARAQIGTQGDMVHVSELIPAKGTFALVATHDLIDDADGIRRVVDKVGSPKKVFVVASAQLSYGEMFRSSVTWAKKIGHAGEVLLASHELAVLLGAEAGHGRMKNGILIVHDGQLVWSAMVDARRPSTPHATLTDFGDAWDRYALS